MVVEELPSVVSVIALVLEVDREPIIVELLFNELRIASKWWMKVGDVGLAWMSTLRILKYL